MLCYNFCLKVTEDEPTKNELISRPTKPESCWTKSISQAVVPRPNQGPTNSIGHLLKTKASQGVKIYIMLFGSDMARLGGFKLGSERIIEEYQPLENFEIMGANLW